MSKQRDDLHIVEVRKEQPDLRLLAKVVLALALQAQQSKVKTEAAADDADEAAS